MEHLFDTVLNGSLSFYGIATAAFPPLIVAGVLALLAFILATLAAFQKRPGQQSAKVLPNFGTLWILGLTAIVLSTAQTPTVQAATSPSLGDVPIPDAIWERISRRLWGDRSGVATAQQAGVYIYKASSTRKTWYGPSPLYHQTSDQNRKTVTSENHLTSKKNDGEDNIQERKFSTYSFYILDKRSRRYRRGYGNRFREPSSYYKRNFFFSEGWRTYKWDCNYVVKSSYSNTNGDQRLNANPPCPKTYKIHLTYKLAKLRTTRYGGIQSTPYEERSTWEGDFKTTQDDEKTGVRLLKRNTEMYEGPTAVGSCKRNWEWDVTWDWDSEIGRYLPTPGYWDIRWYIDVTIQPKKEGE